MPETPGYQRFFAELKRRRVFRVMAVYGAVAFVILQVADISLPGLGLPEWTITLILALTVLGFPIAVRGLRFAALAVGGRVGRHG